MFLVYRQQAKAALLAGLLLSFNFFFRAIHDFLKANARTLSRYSVLLPASAVIIIFTGIYLKKTKRHIPGFTFFLNILILIYLLIDAGTLIWQVLHLADNKLFIYGFDKRKALQPCNECPNPDIYILVFDEYSSSANIDRVFHYNNKETDSFLHKRDFMCRNKVLVIIILPHFPWHLFLIWNI